MEDGQEDWDTRRPSCSCRKTRRPTWWTLGVIVVGGLAFALESWGSGFCSGECDVDPRIVEPSDLGFMKINLGGADK